MRFTLVFFSILIFAVSCNRQPEINFDFLNDESLSISSKIQRYLGSDSLLRTRFSPDEIKLLRAYYEKVDYEPTVALTDSNFQKKGKELTDLVKNSLAYGVPSELCIPLNDTLHPVEIELRTLVNLSRILSVVKHGFFDFTTKKTKEVKPVELSMLSMMLSKKQKSSRDKFIIKQGPISDTNYRFLAKGIYQFANSYLIDTLNYDYKKDKEVKNNPKSFAIKSLRSKGYMNASYNLSLFQNALLEFKTDNGLDNTFELNEYTLEALSESNKHRLTRASISLDKVRQHAPYGPRYVRINIPEYNLYFYANDSLKAIHRVVVGKRNTQTPELVSEIRTIIIYPYWKVPTSIIKKEIMPEVYKNPSYLSRHHYKLCRFNDTARINPSTINWNNRPSGYNVIQMPGNWNSLGVIKFEFLSNHSVYVHDTPQKGLFSRNIRSFSHGCMRCQNPIELGKTIILNDQKGRRRKSMPVDTLDSLVRIGEHDVISLKNRIPIFVEYQTVTTHQKRLTFHVDIYYREEEIIRILKQQNPQKKPTK
ncbi:MAG: L,D-transpeptidase family protein [Flavobacteriales bacterium]